MLLKEVGNIIHVVALQEWDALGAFVGLDVESDLNEKDS